MKTKVKLPNIRSMFIPDPGYLICDADLAGADAQVVAWEAEDEDLKNAFRSGIKIHKKNGADMWGSKFTSLSEDDPAWKRMYNEIKQGVHLTNYGGKASTLARTMGITRAEASAFQSRWFSIHPNILKWHARVLREITTTQRITNRFGYSFPLYNRPDDAFTQALALVPQSTVALTTFYGARNVDRVFNPNSWENGINHPSDIVQWLLQVHDNLLWQMRRELRTRLKEIANLLRVPIPYDDPLTISWGIAVSEKSWGDMEAVKF